MNRGLPLFYIGSPIDSKGDFWTFHLVDSALLIVRGQNPLDWSQFAVLGLPHRLVGRSVTSMMLSAPPTYGSIRC